MKNMKWLDEFAEKQKESTTKKVTASKKKALAKLDGYDMIILSKNMLPTAVEGNTVKYRNKKWKVVNASYKDAMGSGVVLASAEERAYTNPGNVYDYNVRETTEIPDFEAAASETAEQIARENAVDHCTTPAARYMNPVLIKNTVVEELRSKMEDPTPVVTAPPAEEPALEDASVTEDVVDELGSEDTPAEDVVDEAPAVEETVEKVETPIEDEFTFDDVVDAPLEEDEKEEEKTADVEDEDVLEKKAEKKQNRIIAKMLEM
jgi:hypothetical protein